MLACAVTKVCVMWLFFGSAGASDGRKLAVDSVLT